MISIEEILIKIEKETNTSREELLEKISRKQKSLSGLVSLEGAAHLVAKDLGLDLLEKMERRLEMKNVMSGMKNVNVIGRVFRISNINEFKRSNGSSGRVANIYLGDNTGHLRLALWDKQVSVVEDGLVKLGGIVQVINALARENVFGDIEISIGKYGSIKPFEENIDLPSMEELNDRLTSGPRTISIKNITKGVFEIKGTIVQVFKSNFIFNVCPICGNKVEEVEGKFECSEHKKVVPSPALVISAVIDDGTSNMRVVFFRELAEKMLSTQVNELANLDKEKIHELIEEKLLGKQLLLLGRVKKNKIFDRLELIASDFKGLVTLQETKELIKGIEVKIR